MSIGADAHPRSAGVDVMRHASEHRLALLRARLAFFAVAGVAHRFSPSRKRLLQGVGARERVGRVLDGIVHVRLEQWGPAEVGA